MVAVAFDTILPLVPVIVRVVVLFRVLEVVLTVSVDDPEPVTDVGLKAAVAPLGTPLMVKLTVPVNPAPAAVETV